MMCDDDENRHWPSVSRQEHARATSGGFEEEIANGVMVGRAHFASGRPALDRDGCEWDD